MVINNLLQPDLQTKEFQRNFLIPFSYPTDVATKFGPTGFSAFHIKNLEKGISKLSWIQNNMILAIRTEKN